MTWKIPGLMTSENPGLMTYTYPTATAGDWQKYANTGKPKGHNFYDEKGPNSAYILTTLFRK